MKQPMIPSDNLSLQRSNSRLLNHFYSIEVHLKKLDLYLERYPVLHKIGERLQIRPCYIPLISGLLLSLLFGFFDRFITNAMGFFYPAWQSFKAIENPSSSDHKQWLTYWVVYAFFSIVEPIGEFFFFWVPCYYIVKITFLLWLFLPQFHGASLIYAYLIRPLLLHYEGQIDQTLTRVAETAVTVASSIQNPNDHNKDH